MKQFYITLLMGFLCLLTFLEGSSQNLSLSSLETLCSQKNWENVNTILNQKGWEFSDASKGDEENYNTITWSYGKDSYSEKASGWLYLYTFEGFPSKIILSVFGKKSSDNIVNSLSSRGYKSIDSEIEDGEIQTIYSNQDYILKVIQEKRNESDYSSRTYTAYKFQIIKKNSIYDKDNGPKVQTLDDGSIAYYSLKNKKIDGPVKVTAKDGGLEMTGSYIGGKKNGLFKRYNAYSELESEYLMADDVLNGTKTEYEYDLDTDKLNRKTTTPYFNGKRNGVSKSIYIDAEDKEHLRFEITLENDELNGNAKIVVGDSLVVERYKNDKKDGPHKTYVDQTRLFLGGITRTEINDLTLITEGFYKEGMKTGLWKYYDLTGALRNEGEFNDNQKVGEWRNYNTTVVDVKNGSTPTPYSRKLSSIENYKSGILEGPQILYWSVDKIARPCKENEQEPCSQLVYEKVEEIKNYKNNTDQGSYILKDSLGRSVIKGQYEKGKKEGTWSYRRGEYGKHFFHSGNFFNGVKDGIWTDKLPDDRIIRTTTFKQDKLDGSMLFYDDNGSILLKYDFYEGNLDSYTLLDTESKKPIERFKILSTNENYHNIEITTFSEEEIVSQRFQFKNQERGKKLDYLSFDKNIKVLFESDKKKGGSYFSGKYQVRDLNEKLLIAGYRDSNGKYGEWTYFNYKQKVKYQVTHKNSSTGKEKYFNLEGKKYSGEFVWVDTVNKTKEVRKIKDGLRDGKTIIYDLNTEKKIEVHKYKAGVKR